MSGLSRISSLFGTVNGTSQSNSLSYSDYASIKNGSYGRLVRSYYRNQENERKAAAVEKSSANLTSVRSGADNLKRAADVLSDPKLWEKKKLRVKNGEAGEEEEMEGYDWDAITKAVDSFADAYNSVIANSGNSDSRDVLRNASWMVGDTQKTAKLLGKVGVEVGADNKLTVNRDQLKEANMGSLKLLFTGHNSFAEQVSARASGISRAAVKTAGIYTKDGTWSSTLNSMVSSRIRKRTGKSDKTEDSERSEKKTAEEMKQLKDRRETLKERIKKEYSPERRREYENELKEIEKELSVRDSDHYPR